ncbi:vegetative incompatibility protein HET-E-1 [Colletotrichum liriopes]|uniref:Vegetative incompatibility protein HET-E-1 n=1 Tax=Colletotrichum liriopes TaxID=708192 RepID=A0AA37GZ36_9PEZI|nr:vegetative incompatibility protein HET-E-1 [Colletotrichum liriopes]
MAEETPLQAFGSTRARNAVVGSQFSGTTHITFYGGPGERPTINPPRLIDLTFQTERKKFEPKKKWMDTAYLKDHNGVFWIKGKPGAGKSTLMKHAFRRYQKQFFSDYFLVAHFFNARGEALEKTSLGMLRSIVYQLLQNDEALYEHFGSTFREKQRTSLEEGLQWRQSELQEIIRSVVTQSHSKPFLLLVDALDECHESEIRDVVTFLESLSISASRVDVQLKICLSSRHYPSIRMGKAIELKLDDSKNHRKDIAKYVNERLIVSDADIKAKILNKANGIFLWVVIVVSLLNKAYDEGQVEAMQRTLEEVPGDLEQIFSTILNKDVSSVYETVLMLQWVLLSRRPLTPRELFAAVVGTAPPTTDLIQRRITTSSKGLIEIRKGIGESVQFIHLSVREFLFRYKRLQALDATLGPEPITTS